MDNQDKSNEEERPEALKGRRISIQEAKAISLRILHEAEKAREDYAEAEARRYGFEDDE